MAGKQYEHAPNFSCPGFVDGGAVYPRSSPLFCSMSLLDLLVEITFFDNNLTSFNFKLGVQAKYPLA